MDLKMVMQHLASQGINELHVEAGSGLNTSLLRDGLVDEFLLYMAPSIVGAGKGMADLGPFDSLASSLRLEFKSIDRIGPDLRILARPPGRDNF